jgi:tRNA threonylcarbamoyladenosine biosynthesis protein TsaB
MHGNYYVRESAERNIHAKVLTIFIDEVFKESGMEISSVDAIAVSEGPGSYTGLRIGISAAKGLCYALNKPLIAISTLKSMAAGAQALVDPDHEEALLCPMIDARRMEVYDALYDLELNEYREVQADIISEESFNELLDERKIYFFGDGSEKCQEILGKHGNAIFLDDVKPSAINMIKLARQSFLDEKFEDVAYFEPYYLKEFVAGVPRVKGLR